jgi:putative ABC transport system permease protein
MVFLNILKESFQFAFSELKVNRLRTLLTLQGVTIGIFAIIAAFHMPTLLKNTIRNNFMP